MLLIDYPLRYAKELLRRSSSNDNGSLTQDGENKVLGRFVNGIQWTV